LPRVATPAFPSWLLCSGLLGVAPYCVPGGIRVVSGVREYPRQPLPLQHPFSEVELPLYQDITRTLTEGMRRQTEANEELVSRFFEILEERD
jgi:hypothetical protein